MSIMFSLVSIPVAAAVFLRWMDLSGTPLAVPAGAIVLQLGLFVVLPVLLGMWLGTRFERELAPWNGRLRIFSLGLVGLLLAVSIWTVREELAARLPEIAAMAILFIFGAMFIGALIARFVTRGDRHVVVIETTVRNIPVAVLIGGSVAMNPASAGFVAGYFLIEVLVMVPFAFWVRRRRASSV